MLAPQSQLFVDSLQLAPPPQSLSLAQQPDAARGATTHWLATHAACWQLESVSPVQSAARAQHGGGDVVGAFGRHRPLVPSQL
jgi:hypothetical protein